MGMLGPTPRCSGSPCGGTIALKLFRFEAFPTFFSAAPTMNQRSFSLATTRVRHPVLALLCAACVSLAWAHGDVTPQAVDTSSLPKLGSEWKSENPYRANAAAVKVGASAYNQNCARCHGLEAISGGIAPDLRKLDNDCSLQKQAAKKAACVAEMDVYYSGSVRRGKVRNGAVYMPPFEGILNQEAVWSIKAYLETRRERPL